MSAPAYSCPVCGGSRFRDRYLPLPPATEEDFRPSSLDYGRPPGRVVRCTSCGHSFAVAVSDEQLRVVYEGVEDPVTLREEPGEIATASRDLKRIERLVRPGRLLDVGCWTGSFLVAAAAQGWEPLGLEPSHWAAARADTRGVAVLEGTFPDPRLEPRSFRLIALRDVIEHLPDPGGALDEVARLLEPHGVLFLALPDAGSVLAGLLGRRWWSVMPMHVQYFTRASMSTLLDRHGFSVLSLRTHTKVFSLEYYAERLAAFARPLGAPLLRSTRGRAFGRRLVAPNFRDRMGVIATRAAT